ncbi:MAG: MvaI/BcnI family restriction endonuclease [Dehalococcoidia bacterium]|nr:MvaI/BcnI family restriction endonuclease [Dehalococcoidia bacterium]
MPNPTLYTKEDLIGKFKEIKALGWVENHRHGNAGGVGNTLEDLLGIEENNLPIPNAAEWELKTQRGNTTSLTTLFHMEPSPRAVKFVPTVLLLNYGWAHNDAGGKYTANEMSFRQTISTITRSDRGFKVVIDRKAQKILISFDAASVDNRHASWLEQVGRRIGLSELSPQPYWGFVDLEHKAGTKLLNAFYARAEIKRENGKEFYRYSSVLMLKKFGFEKFLQALENGTLYVDFDARTGHNHGTKFRLRHNCLPDLYESVAEVL